MKKFFCIYLALVTALLLSSCNSTQKSELEKLTNREIKEEAYTSASYCEYKKALKKAHNVIENPFSSSKKILDAQKDLQTALDGLETATLGVYQIEYNFTLKSNDHVGNDWKKIVKFNALKVENGDTVNASPNGIVGLNITVIENDKNPDVGKITIDVQLGSKTSNSAEIIVRERDGKYSGNIAVWEFNYTIVLTERK